MSLPCINFGSAATDRPPGARGSIVSPADLAAHSKAQKPPVDERIEVGIKGLTDKKGCPRRWEGPAIGGGWRRLG
ncbi:hypothetical protein H2199_004002 [Coniosporium tulheliwenetii]|uniref:Uncharacterized protein n=1 Tax=Coniosporium tulheliwenetii TaxID=3383036 RepID=A0ACC2Z9B8_9PEZI|nr:hypothetical protein H2199_004002 [Cladosporium sp. JES 115]